MTKMVFPEYNYLHMQGFGLKMSRSVSKSLVDTARRPPPRKMSHFYTECLLRKIPKMPIFKNSYKVHEEVWDKKFRQNTFIDFETSQFAICMIQSAFPAVWWILENR